MKAPLQTRTPVVTRVGREALKVPSAHRSVDRVRQGEQQDGRCCQRAEHTDQRLDAYGHPDAATIAVTLQDRPLAAVGDMSTLLEDYNDRYILNSSRCQPCHTQRSWDHCNRRVETSH